MENSTTTAEGLRFRERLRSMFTSTPLANDELMFNLGLYVRSSLLVKFLVLDDLYRRILPIPGALVEFGVWRGQSLVLLENLRAIHAPFDKVREIVGFDTFEGYESGAYRTGAEYEEYLQELLNVHEGINAFGHLRGNHRLIAGNVADTAPRFFSDFKHFVALAIFDIGAHTPTYYALLSLRSHLLPGSVLLMDNLNEPGEAKAFKDAFGSMHYRAEKCPLYPSKTIITVERR